MRQPLRDHGLRTAAVELSPGHLVWQGRTGHRDPHRASPFLSRPDLLANIIADSVDG
ncbi:MAG: hypothetical protein ACRDT0_07345 [Pseudonocardiaceae bacterium]